MRFPVPPTQATEKEMPATVIDDDTFYCNTFCYKSLASSVFQASFEAQKAMAMASFDEGFLWYLENSSYCDEDEHRLLPTWRNLAGECCSSPALVNVISDVFADPRPLTTTEHGAPDAAIKLLLDPSLIGSEIPAQAPEADCLRTLADRLAFWL